LIDSLIDAHDDSKSGDCCIPSEMVVAV